MRSKVILLLAAMAAAVLVAMGTALAQTAPQGTLTAGNLSQNTNAWITFNNFLWNAQTFTADVSGEATSAQILICIPEFGTPPTDPFWMELTNVDDSGLPTGGTLASTNPIPASSVDGRWPTGCSLVTGVFDDPVYLEAGQQYALVLKTESGFAYAVAFSAGNDPYGQGMAAWQFDPSGVFGTPGAWSGGGSADLIFAVYVKPEVTFDSLCEQAKEFVSNKGIADSMCAQLEVAEKAAERGKIDTAEKALKAFKNAVSAQENTKELTSNEADDLLEGADQLIDALHNNT